MKQLYSEHVNKSERTNIIMLNSYFEIVELIIEKNTRY